MCSACNGKYMWIEILQWELNIHFSREIIHERWSEVKNDGRENCIRILHVLVVSYISKQIFEVDPAWHDRLELLLHNNGCKKCLWKSTNCSGTESTICPFKLNWLLGLRAPIFHEISGSPLYFVQSKCLWTFIFLCGINFPCQYLNRWQSMRLKPNICSVLMIGSIDVSQTIVQNFNLSV